MTSRLENTTMTRETLALLSAVAGCHQQLTAHARRLRERKDVREVTHHLDMLVLDGGVRFEEFVDAELVCRDALSWCLETTVTPQQVSVEADVRRIHDQGQDVVCAIADCAYSTESAAAAAVPEIVRHLCSLNPT